jgi:hypothetical protein
MKDHPENGYLNVKILKMNSFRIRIFCLYLK